MALGSKLVGIGTGGPVALITNRCLFGFDRTRARFTLAAVGATTG